MSTRRPIADAIINALQRTNYAMTKSDINEFIGNNNTNGTIKFLYDEKSAKLFIPQLDYEMRRLISKKLIYKNYNGLYELSALL